MSNENTPSFVGQTHTARLLKTCLAADRMSRDTGIPRRECKTIIGAALDRLNLEEKARLAAEMEAEGHFDERDQT